MVGGENRLLVALDEGRLLSDQPQPVLQTRTHVTARPRGPREEGMGEEPTLTASMTMGMPLVLDASKMPCEEGKPG